MARDYLQARIDRGDKMITSINFGIKKGESDIRVAFVSPVAKNIGENGISFEDLVVSLFTVFTNMRIEDSERANQELRSEYGAGCLQSFSKRCLLFDLGREIYRHAPDLKKDARVDVTKKICGYLGEQ